ncbi:hypothetical protein ACQ4PT_030827 [Festuca glaucescens]
MGKGSRRGGGGGGGRGRGAVSENDVQRVAATITDLATQLGFQVTDVGTRAPTPTPTPPRHSGRGFAGRGGGGGGRERGPVSADGVERVGTGRLTPPQRKFILACSDGDVDRIKAVVDSLDEDDRASLPSLRMEGCGPLHSVAGSGNMAVCKYLVEQLGFDVDFEAINHGSGITPLAFAAAHGQVIAARYFLDKGANPNKKNSSRGTTLLHEAAEAGHDEIARLLLSKGASVDASSSYGAPLVAAGVRGKFSVMKILLENNADPNKVSWDFGTPLISTLYGAPERMSESTCLKCVKLLVKAGADVNCTNPETPLAIATFKGLTSCVEYLLEVSRNANLPVNHDKSSDKDSKAQLKSQGAKAVEGKNYATALKFYTEAIKLDPADAVLYSNRSLCHLKCGEAHDALLDADACISLRPEWHKGYYRKGAALMLLLDYKEASDAFLAGVKLDPKNKEMKKAFWEAVEAMRKEHSEPSLYTVD